MKFSVSKPFYKDILTTISPTNQMIEEQEKSPVEKIIDEMERAERPERYSSWVTDIDYDPDNATATINGYPTPVTEADMLALLKAPSVGGEVNNIWKRLRGK